MVFLFFCFNFVCVCVCFIRISLDFLGGIVILPSSRLTRKKCFYRTRLAINKRQQLDGTHNKQRKKTRIFRLFKINSLGTGCVNVGYVYYICALFCSINVRADVRKRNMPSSRKTKLAKTLWWKHLDIRIDSNAFTPNTTQHTARKSTANRRNFIDAM